MVQAAAISALDFTAANPRSRQWWLKTRWILDRVEDLNVMSLYQMQHRQHTSVLDYSSEQQVFDAHWRPANELVHQCYCINFPWAKDANSKQRSRGIDQLMEEWKKRYGDPNDPAVQAHFLKVAQAMRRRGEKAKQNMFADQRNMRAKLQKLNKSRAKKRGKK